MVIRILSIITLISFILLLLNETAIDRALFQSLVLFLVLFTVIQLSLMLIQFLQSGESESRRTKESRASEEPEKSNEQSPS